MKWSGRLLVGFAICGSSLAWAEPISFDAAVTRARQQNAQLQNAEAQAQAAQYRLQGAGSGFFPQVSGTATYSDFSGSGVTDTSQHSVGITATQNVFAGFGDQARVEQSEAGLVSAQASVVRAKAQLSHDLKVAYAGLLYAQDNVALSENILRRLEENLRLVELRFEGGRENKGSYLLTRASVAQARLDLLQARQALNAAQAQLARVMGETDLEWQASNTVPTQPPPATPDFMALARNAPDFEIARAEQAAADAGTRVARAGFYPSVNVSGTVGRNGQQWFPDNDRNGVSATVSVPIFTGGKNYYGVQEALATRDAAKANREAVERELVVRLRGRHASYVEAAERLSVDREFLDAAQTRASIARARYQNGLISFEDWDRIESELIQRQRAWLTAQRTRVAAEAAWELAQGKGVIP